MKSDEYFFFVYPIRKEQLHCVTVLACSTLFISLPLFITSVDQSVETWKGDKPTHDEKWERDEAVDSYDQVRS